jgi:hypothetical protein
MTTAHRAIDTPIEELTAIDEHSIEVDAPAEQTWEALFPTLNSVLDGNLGRRMSSGLGCRETEAEGDLQHPGGTLPGFVVARAVPPVLLALLGEHRYSRYALVFRIDLLPGQRSRVRAETRAEFPGIKGSLYKAGVIGTRGHVFAVRSILKAVKRRAERRVSSD